MFFLISPLFAPHLPFQTDSFLHSCFLSAALLPPPCPARETYFRSHLPEPVEPHQTLHWSWLLLRDCALDDGVAVVFILSCSLAQSSLHSTCGANDQTLLHYS